MSSCVDVVLHWELVHVMKASVAWKLFWCHVSLLDKRVIILEYEEKSLLLRPFNNQWSVKLWLMSLWHPAAAGCIHIPREKWANTVEGLSICGFCWLVEPHTKRFGLRLSLLISISQVKSVRPDKAMNVPSRAVMCLYSKCSRLIINTRWRWRYCCTKKILSTFLQFQEGWGDFSPFFLPVQQENCLLIESKDFLYSSRRAKLWFVWEWPTKVDQGWPF